MSQKGKHGNTNHHISISASVNCLGKVPFILRIFYIFLSLNLCFGLNVTHLEIHMLKS